LDAAAPTLALALTIVAIALTLAAIALALAVLAIPKLGHTRAEALPWMQLGVDFDPDHGEDRIRVIKHWKIARFDPINTDPRQRCVSTERYLLRWKTHITHPSHVSSSSKVAPLSSDVGLKSEENLPNDIWV
jgi:hypothetical protein